MPNSVLPLEAAAACARTAVLALFTLWPHHLETTQHKLPSCGTLGALMSLCALRPSTAMGLGVPKNGESGRRPPQGAQLAPSLSRLRR